MRKQEFQKYIYQMLSGFGAISLSILFFFVLFKMNVVGNYLGKVTNTLMPFIYGCVMAYLIYPMSNWITKKLDQISDNRATKITKSMGIAIGLGIVGFAIYLLLWMLLPQLIESIVSIGVSMPSRVDSLTVWITSILSDNPKLQEMAGVAIENSSVQLQDWFGNNIIPKAQDFITSLSVGVVSTVWGLFDFIIGIIVCVYILASADKLKYQAKLIVQALFNEKNANMVFNLTKEMDLCFGGFIRGKLVDSLIIGILCFICTSIMNMPYALLISTIVGVTNIIPFFGPFVGAIPSAILILTVSPIQSLYFIIFILILQQFDGNILGPAILGQSTGIGSIWVLFSILIFGDMFGFVGMVIGVPLFSVIYFLISKFVFKRLRQNDMDAEIEEYRMKYPDKRKERDEKQQKKEKEEEERDRKFEKFLNKLKKFKK